MKRYIIKTTVAFLIMVLAMSETIPLHASASHGTVTISGNVRYQGRDWDPQKYNWQYGKELKVDLYEKDNQGTEHWLNRTTVTDSYGHYIFDPIENWSSYDNDRYSIFIKITTDYPANSPNTSVTDYDLEQQYHFPNTFYPPRIGDGPQTINFDITNTWQSHQAIWIFEDLRNAWNFVHNNFSGYDPTPSGKGIRAIWQDGVDCIGVICNSYTWDSGTQYIFISNLQVNWLNVVAHEAAHMYMINASGWWDWYPNCWTHYINATSNAKCAWSEGWADFFSIAVNNVNNDKPCYTFGPFPCEGLIDQQYFNLEVHSRGDNPSLPYAMPWGDNVEGRVAAALYDLYDYNDEGFDRIHAGFLPIAIYALGSSRIETFRDFWNNWQNIGQDPFLTGLTLWWNTIDYLNIKQIYLPIVTKSP
jgi:hypothetical protein